MHKHLSNNSEFNRSRPSATANPNPKDLVDNYCQCRFYLHFKITMEKFLNISASCYGRDVENFVRLQKYEWTKQDNHLFTNLTFNA